MYQLIHQSKDSCIYPLWRLCGDHSSLFHVPLEGVVFFIPKNKKYNALKFVKYLVGDGCYRKQQPV